MEKVKYTETQNRTPLKELAKVLVKNNIFPNQTIMYRTLVVLAGYEIRINNKKQSYTTDDLIFRIRNYLENLGEPDNGQYDKLHEDIGNVLINGDFNLNKKLDNYEDMLSLSGKDSLRSNVNHIICGKRKISGEWAEEYKRNSDNTDIIIRRIWWIIQYYFAFYNIRKTDIYRNYTSGSGEYIILSSQLSRKMFKELQSACQGYSSYLRNVDSICFNLGRLSGVIFEMIQAHYSICDKGEQIYQKQFRGGFVGDIILCDGRN